MHAAKIIITLNKNKKNGENLHFFSNNADFHHQNDFSDIAKSLIMFYFTILPVLSMTAALLSSVVTFALPFLKEPASLKSIGITTLPVLSM